MSSSRKSNSAARTHPATAWCLHHHAVTDAKCRELLPLPQRDLDDGDSVGLDECVAQQHVRFGRLPLRLEVVGLREEDRVDLIGRHELQHVDRARRRQRQVGEVLIGQDDHLAAAEVVPLGDVVVGDLFAIDRAHPLVFDAAAILAVHLVEANVLLFRRGIQFYRDGHESEGHRALPDGPHRDPPTSSAEITLSWVLCPGRPLRRCLLHPARCRSVTAGATNSNGTACVRSRRSMVAGSGSTPAAAPRSPLHIPSWPLLRPRYRVRCSMARSSYWTRPAAHLSVPWRSASTSVNGVAPRCSRRAGR